MSRPAARRVCLAGLLFVVLLAPAAWRGAEEKKKPSRPVNLNSATVEELARLPGVGPTIAARIVRHREKSGKFRAVEELLVIRGISRRRLEALRPHVTVDAKEAQEAKEAEEKKPAR